MFNWLFKKTPKCYYEFIPVKGEVFNQIYEITATTLSGEKYTFQSHTLKLLPQYTVLRCRECGGNVYGLSSSYCDHRTLIEVPIIEAYALPMDYTLTDTFISFLKDGVECNIYNLSKVEKVLLREEALQTLGYKEMRIEH